MTGDLFPVPRPQHDPGGARRLPLKLGVHGSAQFSSCTRYRYWLMRRWGDPGAPYMLSIGANPSTADARVDDPTLRIDQAIARREGFTRLFKANVLDYRATNPRDLLAEDVIPCSDRNFEGIEHLAAGAEKIFLCWGALHPSLGAYAERVVRLLPKDRPLWCLGMTKDGQPRHPLYTRADTPLVQWR